jgi:hypothetical protein
MVNNNYPSTGRIGRFIKIIQSDVDSDIYSVIFSEAYKYDSYSSKEKSLWWKNTIEKMESAIGNKRLSEVMTKCGGKCCGQGQRKTARRLFLESRSIEDFLKKISKHDVKEGDLTYTLKDKYTIIAEHNKCFCKQVSNSPEIFTSKVYCQCSVEFNRQFFTHAFEKEVHVELVDSIICGGKSCKFIVKIVGN